MILTIETVGDHSVGINPAELKIEVTGLSRNDFDPEIIQVFVAMAAEMSNLLTGNEPIRYCYFDDQCPQCGTFRIEDDSRECSNPNCVVNIPDAV